ncbi:hypothetical protein EG832_08490 [bacterium]|nr:hypothetical protein [bacterium]
MQIETNPLHDIPNETSVAARNLYNVQHIYLRIGDQLNTILSRVNVELFDSTSSMNQIALSRLALTSAFQLAEGLSDIQAAQSTYQRLDWKYALCLPVKHPGISEYELCRFRQGLYISPVAQRQFSVLLAELRRVGLFPRSTAPLLDTLGALDRICQITRLYTLDLAIKEALGMLVASAPDWLLGHVSPHWYERYSTRRVNPGHRFAAEDLQIEANRLGTDVLHLLDALQQEDAGNLAQKPEIKTLHHLFHAQFTTSDDAVQWQPVNCADCSFYYPIRGGQN